MAFEGTDNVAYSDEGLAFYNEVAGDGRDLETVTNTFNDKTLSMRSLAGVFGAPYQFLPSVDPRVFGNVGSNVASGSALDKFGRKYAEKIVERMPVMYFSPGNPRFMPQVKQNKASIVSAITSFLTGGSKNDLQELLDDYTGKYYYIDMAYEDYYSYVNPMCRSGAMFLGLQDEMYCGHKLRNFPWHLNTQSDTSVLSLANSTTGSVEHIADATVSGLIDTIGNFIGQYTTENFAYYRRCIPFYVESEAQITENFTNDTTESSLAGMANGISDQARELQFILGATSSELGIDYNKIYAGGEELLNKIEAQLGGEGHNVFANIVKTFGTIAMGGRLVFPEIWSDSKFGKNYSVTIKLATPDSDLLSWYLNIYVPLMHLLGLTLPRQYGNNGYGAPFLVRAYYKGFFNIDMGIITNLTVVKGKEAGWTRDGLPTSVEVSVEIKDLYQEMSMANTENIRYNIMKNTAELDYMANLCGVNINAPDLTRFIEMYYMNNIENRIMDHLTNDIWGGLQSAITNKTLSAWNSLIGR